MISRVLLHYSVSMHSLILPCHLDVVLQIKQNTIASSTDSTRENDNTRRRLLSATQRNLVFLPCDTHMILAAALAKFGDARGGVVAGKDFKTLLNWYKSFIIALFHLNFIFHKAVNAKIKRFYSNKECFVIQCSNVELAENRKRKLKVQTKTDLWIKK